MAKQAHTPEERDTSGDALPEVTKATASTATLTSKKLFDVPLHPEQRQKLIRPAWLVGVVATIALAIGLTIYEANSDHWPHEVEQVSAGIPPDPYFNPDDALRLVQSGVLLESDATAIETGIAMTGSVSPAVAESAETVANQAVSILRHSCTHSLTLAMPDNMQIAVYGHCFSAPSAETLTDYIDFAINNNVHQLVFTEHVWWGGASWANISWTPRDREEYTEALESWTELDVPRELDGARLITYGIEDVAGFVDHGRLTRNGLVVGPHSKTPLNQELDLPSWKKNKVTVLSPN